MKIGFLGGSFDPIHLGHLLIAQDAAEQTGLDRLFFVPAAVPPLKGRELTAGPDDRLAMVRLAIEDDPRFGALDDELRRGGVSYTVDTARELRRRFPGDRLFWIVGSDQLAQLAQWRDAAALAGLVEFIHVGRPGCAAAAPDLPGLRVHPVRGHEVEISSSELRDRAGRGLPLRHFVPPRVEAFIAARSLYRKNA